MESSLQFILLPLFFVCWCVAILRNRRYTRVQKMVDQASREPQPQAAALPPVSVIVTTYEQCDALRHGLPAILEQEYAQEFEVIVVDMNSTDDTLPYLRTLEDRYPNLRVVRMPDTARNVSPIRLALTLGIRAAAHEWVAITQANCQPSSPHWLTWMGRQCAEGGTTNIVVGYTQFTRRSGWNAQRCRFFRLWQQMLHLPYAERHGAYRCEGCNLFYRRSFFIGHRGFAEDVNLLVGATDIMVNHSSNSQNTRLSLHPEAFMRQACPESSRWWQQERLFFMETRSHFRRWLRYRLAYLSHVVLTWLFTLCTLAALLVETIVFENYILAAVVAVLWLVHAVVRTVYFNRAARALNERPLTFWLPLLLHLVALWDTTAWLQWRFMKKQVFQKKYI